MEALALGRPAITTYVAGIPELVENGRSGWLIPAGSVDAMKGAIRQALATSVEDLTRMGKAGAEAAAQRHDANREAARLGALFRQVVGGLAPTSPAAGSVSADLRPAPGVEVDVAEKAAAV
jgi:colanic acid/amylovoran biosynthesis glycosyltransferase